MGNKNFEIWVVDTPAVLAILDNLGKLSFEEYLKDKVVVVPLAVYNDVLSEMRIGLYSAHHYVAISRKADMVVMLADALRFAAHFKYADDEGLAFARGSVSGETSYSSKVKFAFVLDAVNLRNTVDYCNREIELITKQICEREGIDSESLEEWPKVKVIESIIEVSEGRFLCEMY